MDERRIEIGERLRKRRLELHLTQEEAAELLDISLTHYKNMERGRASFTCERILQVYEVLGMDPAYLLLGRQSDNAKLAEQLNRLSGKKWEAVERLIEGIVALACGDHQDR